MLPNELQSAKLKIGLPVVRSDRRFMVTSLPNFLGWVDLLTHDAPLEMLKKDFLYILETLLAKILKAESN